MTSLFLGLRQGLSTLPVCLCMSVVCLPTAQAGADNPQGVSLSRCTTYLRPRPRSCHRECTSKTENPAFTRLAAKLSSRQRRKNPLGLSLRPREKGCLLGNGAVPRLVRACARLRLNLPKQLPRTAHSRRPTLARVAPHDRFGTLACGFRDRFCRYSDRFRLRTQAVPDRFRLSRGWPARPRNLRQGCCRSLYSAGFSQKNPRRVFRTRPPLLPMLASPDYPWTPRLDSMSAIGQKQASRERFPGTWSTLSWHPASDLSDGPQPAISRHSGCGSRQGGVKFSDTGLGT
jgi:hypothetical protein